MGLESGTYIDSLNASNPVGATDKKSQGDNHLRLIKSTIKATFPNIAGAVNPAHGVLNSITDQTETAEETAAGATPVNTQYPVWPYIHAFRYLSSAERADVLAGTVTADVSAALQNAIDVGAQVPGRPIYLPAGAYLCDTGLVADYVGFQIIGEGGRSKATKLTGGATSGAVLQVKQRNSRVEGIYINSTAARYAASTTTGHGLYFAPDDAASEPSRSHSTIIDVQIDEQPTDGFHSIGGFELSFMHNVGCTDCLRHGFVWDDGNTAGFTNKQNRPFWFITMNTRALECGGYAYIIGHPSQSQDGDGSEHYVLEALGCLWDTSHQISSIDYLILVSSWNCVITCDVEDQQYDQTTTQNGNTRTAKANPSFGMYLFGAHGTRLPKSYWSSLQGSMFVNGAHGIEVNRPRIAQGNWGSDQAKGFEFDGASNHGSHLDIDVTQVSCTEIIETQTEEMSYTLDGLRYTGLPGTTGDWAHPNAAQVTEQTISGAVLTFSADVVKVAGQGGLDDTLNRLRITSSTNGYDGLRVTLLWNGTEDITIGHGVVNIQTKSGANITLDTTRPAITFAYNEAADIWQEQ